MNDNLSHEERVHAFLKECKENDREGFEKVCDKYPVQSRLRKSVVRKREITVGLLGLSPSRISPAVAQQNDMETIFVNDESE